MGAYMLDHFSVESRPYLYEMMPFALLMKLGIVGFGLYLAAIFGLLLSMVKGMVKSGNKLVFSGATISFFLAANTNPILYSFVGMVAVSFILIWWVELIGTNGDGVLFVREATSEGEVK